MENRTVLDTNIWVDFFISKRTRELIELIDQNKAVFLRSKPAIAEFERVLSYEKFKKYYSPGNNHDPLFLFLDGFNEVADIDLQQQQSIFYHSFHQDKQVYAVVEDYHIVQKVSCLIFVDIQGQKNLHS